jgi:phage-related protein
MYKIIIYRDKSGNEPITEYIKELEIAAAKNKSERIKLKKILEYMAILSEYGSRAGVPYVKHIEDDIWELRPTNDRFFYIHWKDEKYLLLHHFTKTTQKTPKRELEQAKRNLADFLERSDDFE